MQTENPGEFSHTQLAVIVENITEVIYEEIYFARLG